MIKIRTKKVISKNGAKMREILDIEGVMDQKDLPVAYLTGLPQFYMEVVQGYNVCTVHNLSEGDMYTIHLCCSSRHLIEEGDWQETLGNLREAGEKLHTIRKDIKKKGKSWKGEETVTI